MGSAALVVYRTWLGVVAFLSLEASFVPVVDMARVGTGGLFLSLEVNLLKGYCIGLGYFNFLAVGRGGVGGRDRGSRDGTIRLTYWHRMKAAVLLLYCFILSPWRV